MMIEDCIAMSEDGDWYAFPGTATRAQVISAIASEDSSWMEVLRTFHVKQGFVVEEGDDPLDDKWYWQCEADTPGAIPCWIAKRR